MSKGYQGYFMTPNKRVPCAQLPEVWSHGSHSVKYTVQSARNLLRFNGSEMEVEPETVDNTWP